VFEYIETDLKKCVHWSPSPFVWRVDS
jgi:hypothetical protein